MEEQHRGSPKPKSERIQRLVRSGSGTFADVSASAAGSAVGFVMGGPAGAIAGGVVSSLASKCFRRIGEEITGRTLSPREEARVGRVYALAAADLGRRIDEGEELRDDGFFARTGRGRSDAEEVIEGVLLKSQSEPEEKKLPYMATLLSSVAFDKVISAEMAHQIVKAAEDMTYRQLCLLRLSAIKDQLGLRRSDYRGYGSFSRELLQVLYECYDLSRRGFVNFGGDVAFGPSDVKPGGMTVQGLGAEAYNLMRLSSIPITEITPVASELR